MAYIHVILMFFIGVAVAPHTSADTVQGWVLEPGFTLVNPQGARYAIADIVPPAFDKEEISIAEQWLRRVLSDVVWEVRPVRKTPDRYGRHEARFIAKNHEGLAESMLRAGMARVGFDIPYAARASALLAIEAKARKAQRGLWPRWPAVAFESASTMSGQYGLVEGRVLRIEEHNGHRFLAFGEDWRTDATGFIPAKVVPRFREPPLAALIGRNVRLRGWIEEKNGPSLLLVQPYTLEVLP
jgi:hypothetical protein